MWSNSYSCRRSWFCSMPCWWNLTKYSSMLNLWLLAGELVYALSFLLLFHIYMKQEKKRLAEKKARRKGIILLAVHTLCLFCLIFFVPDLYVPSLIRLAIILPAGCAKVL